MADGVMEKVRAFLVGLPRRKKRLLQVFTDIVVVWAALWLAFVVRLGIEDMINPFRGHFWLFMAAPVISIPLFIRFGMYRAVMRYFGNDALIAIIKAVSLSALILGVVVYWYSNPALNHFQLLVVEPDHGGRFAFSDAPVFYG